ncbi:MAG TPA: hypothetical protein VM686_15605 [Polyangiaceae bacterium]|nr:hypothetical protein [Polyangiaceae bacterium]
MSSTTSFRRFSWVLTCGLALGGATGGTSPRTELERLAAPTNEASCSEAPARPVRQAPLFGYCTE